jgi:hypothetical protein
MLDIQAASSPSPTTLQQPLHSSAFVNMKSAFVSIVALVGFANAATVTVCANQSFGGTCATFDAVGCSELLNPHAFVKH